MTRLRSGAALQSRADSLEPASCSGAGPGGPARTWRSAPLTRRISRRQFALALGGGVALAAEPFTRLNIGVGTYSYHSLTMPAMIKQLVKLQIAEIEMSRGEFMLLSHPTDAIFRDARALLDKAGIHCVSYYAATIKTEAEVEQAVRFAGLLGATNITCDGSRQILMLMDEHCTAAHLTFGLHNHYFPYKFDYESPEDLLAAMRGLSKTAGVTLDLGHIVSCGYDTVDAVRKLAPYLRLVHLKDVKAAHGEDNVVIGDGIARIPEVMRELRRIRFGGLVAIEYEKEGPVESDMRRAVAFARKLA